MKLFYWSNRSMTLCIFYCMLETCIACYYYFLRSVTVLYDVRLDNAWAYLICYSVVPQLGSYNYDHRSRTNRNYSLRPFSRNLF